MMISKIVAITFLSICAAEHRLVSPKLATSQAFVPQRLHRYDIPMPYKYGEILHSFTPNPIPGPNVQNFQQSIQYAPLHSRIGHKNKNTASEYTKKTPTLSTLAASTTEPSRNMVTRKDHLEPRVPTDLTMDRNGQEQFKCFTPGHHLEGLTTFSRSPGHNAVYRKFPDTAPIEKANKFNYNMRSHRKDPLDEFRILEPTSTTTVMPFDLLHEKLRPFNQHFVLNPNVVGNESPVKQKIKRQYSPYAKFHRLHLNIARVYSPGQVPQKSPVFADTYSLNLGRLPVHSQAYIPPIFQSLPDQKTMLHADNENQRKYRFRLPL